MVSGRHGAMRGVDAACIFGTKQISEHRGLAIAQRIAGDDQLDLVGTVASIARANGPPSLAKTRPGVSRSMMVRSLPKSLDISE